MSKTVFERSEKGQRAYSLPKEDTAWIQFQPSDEWIRKDLHLPELSELNLMRHFIGLSRRNVGIDNCFIPLGSCTMKYNPRINEAAAALSGFTRTHPLAPDEYAQGCLQALDNLVQLLIEITGMDAGSLLPNAGAQGEFVGVKMILAYHDQRNDSRRREFLIPDSAHGTNPATAALAGCTIRSIRTQADGDLDLDHLKESLSEKSAGLMLTNPNTLGLFSKNILEISKIVHSAGGLLYYDGANLNPILEICRPGAMGFDVMHINLHKTFSTPHGGGGPGAGPVLCKSLLAPFLPTPRIVHEKGFYKTLWKTKGSIGHVASFHGNFGVCLRAYLYAILHGKKGLRRIAEQSIINANYLKSQLKSSLKIPFEGPCMHEFVAQADQFQEKGIKALDIAKRILDFGFYAPTVYFPLIVKEGFLIEPTESESKSTLDAFAEAIAHIVKEIETVPETVQSAPHSLSVHRLDEVKAAKEPILVDPKIKEKR
ncbi:MAG: aminomethyl-transferring glycine dehydrogenase subunit GcvPB [Parachlamydiaceae bacterium]